jgi:hypothetical protein
MLTLALLAAAQAAPAPSDVKAYGDWAVACDNLHACEATSLMPGEELSDDPPQVSIAREGGPAGALSVEISIVLRGAAAGQLVDAILKGQAMTTRAGDGKVLSQASLKGISASLRYFDAGQGRAGTVTALVAKGSKAAATVPAAPPAPQVRFVRPAGKPEAVGATLRAAMNKQADCDSVYEGSEGGKPQIETHALGGGKTLALLPCGSGAYNFSTVPYVIERGKAVVARFDQVPGWTESEGIATLVNGGWDPARAELSSYTKGRGLGDCGSSETFVWDGAMFRLVEMRAMGECRGSANWLRVWKAEPVPAR